MILKIFCKIKEYIDVILRLKSTNTLYFIKYLRLNYDHKLIKKYIIFKIFFPRYTHNKYLCNQFKIF